MKNKVIFSGYYGEENTGDDAFCSVMSWVAQNYLLKQAVFMADKLPILPCPATCLFRENQLFRGQNKFKLFLGLTSIRRVVFAGGSIFHGDEGWMRRYTDLLNSIVPIKMGAIGVSVGPFRNSDAKMRVTRFLQKLSFLVLRDRASFEIACSMDLPYQPVHGFDLAGLLPCVYPHVLRGSARDCSNIVGVIPCSAPYGGDLSFTTLSSENKSLLEVVLELERTSTARFRFFIFNGNHRFGDGDLVNFLASNVVDQSRVEIVQYSPDPCYAYSLIAECKSVLSVRLHGAIFALMAGVPFCLGEYHRKCTDFLDEIDLPQCFRIGNFDQTAAKIASLITSNELLTNQVFKSGDYWKDRSIVNISELKGSALWS